MVIVALTTRNTIQVLACRPVFVNRVLILQLLYSRDFLIFILNLYYFYRFISGECWLGNTYGSLGIGSPSSCYRTCSLNTSLICGGAWRNSEVVPWNFILKFPTLSQFKFKVTPLITTREHQNVPSRVVKKFFLKNT